MGRLSAEQTRVTFVIRHETKIGERLLIAGNHPTLGGWDQLRAPELTTSKTDFPKWSITLILPAGQKLYYKYICMSPVIADNEAADSNTKSPEQSTIENLTADRQFVPTWEPFEDYRVIDTESRATMVIDDGKFSVFNNQDMNRVRIVSRVLSSRASRESLDSDSRNTGNMDSISRALIADSLIIALYRLPIIADRDPETGSWSFSWDDDALYLTCTGIRRGFDKIGIEPLWVGILNTPHPVAPKERDTVTNILRESFNCIPIFLPQDIQNKFYQGFCKGVLWRPFHMLTNASKPDGRTLLFDEEAWHVYQRVNRDFATIIAAQYERQLIWVHDYHLMMLPYYLRVRLSGVRIGFYLHIPWPSSEIFRVLPVRKDILNGMLSATMLGFHLFDYARHFLSACVRLLNLEHQASRGSLGIEYNGRHVRIRVSHIGADIDRFSYHLIEPRVRQMAAEYEAKYPSKTVLGAIDDLDYIKGIPLKLIAFEHYLRSASARVRSNVALIQVALPKMARADAAVGDEIRELVERINSMYGTEDHQPVLYVEKAISFDERIAIYSVCDALFLTPIRDGLNLIPYEYIVSTPQGKGQLILSEFTGCSRALSSAVRVNPWNIDEVRDVIDNVVQKREARAAEIRLKHEADRKYVTEHSSALWAESFLQDLGEASESVQEVVRLGLSRAGGFQRLEFDGFTKLTLRPVVKAYRESKRRLFFFDYDGTLTQSGSGSTHMAHTWARPTEEILQHLEILSREPDCRVTIMSGRGVETEGFHLPQMKKFGIAAEHGFYYKKADSTNWEELAPEADLTWIETAHRIMKVYQERTDGSYIELKTAGLVWHYLAADPEFGQWQAKEMHDHLESILTSCNVQVVSGHGWLQVRLASVNKGKTVARLLEDIGERPDFILCCGDDRTDEDMFEVLENDARVPKTNLFTATVGVKPSKARYYVRNPDEVAKIIESLAEVSLPSSTTHVRSTTFEDMRPFALGQLPSSDNLSTGASSSSGVLPAMKIGFDHV